MHKPIHIPAWAEIARYTTDQPNPRYRGNKLIEALPPAMSEEEILAALEYVPEFDPESRNLPNHVRIHELMSLTNIMVPMASHVQLAQTLDCMKRQGYVGRRPLSAEHMAIYQEIHADAQAYAQDKRAPFRQTADSVTTQLSTALIGVSGMGKTTTVRRALAPFPKLIYHPQLNLFQIPYIHFEMPSDGKGTKALYGGIIERFDELLPDENYYYDFVVKGKPSAPAMGHSVRRLLNKHCVGLLIADELQNVSNTRQEDRLVMTEMTTLSNSKAPVLWIGTNKARKVLGVDFSIGRRGTGLGQGGWHALPEKEWAVDESGGQVLVDGEWVSFMRVLWKYQWVRTYVPLTDDMLRLFYHCTQGIIDLAIKLFIVSQARAIVDSSEKLTEQLVTAVYENDMRLVHPMVEALRNNDMAALIRYEDVKPLDLKDMVEDLERRYRGQRMPAASARPGTADFEHRVTAAATALGIPAEDAAALAKTINDKGTAKNMFEAAQQMGKLMAVPKPVPTPRGKGKSGKKEKLQAEYPDLSERPLDYRTAIVAARTEGTSVIAQLLNRNMLPDPEELVCLD